MEAAFPCINEGSVIEKDPWSLRDRYPAGTGFIEVRRPQFVFLGFDNRPPENCAFQLVSGEKNGSPEGPSTSGEAEVVYPFSCRDCRAPAGAHPLRTEVRSLERSEDTNLTRETKRLTFQDPDLMRALCGEQNAHLRIIEKKTGASVHSRGNELTLQGSRWEIDLAENTLRQIYALLEAKYPLFQNDVDYALRILGRDPSVDLKKIFRDEVYISSKKKTITPKTINQKYYIESIRKFDIVFGIGPAGTGKTYLAMAMGVAWLMKKEVSRIVLARPAVEAGEHLGFLPGDLSEKVNPYLRPLYDALRDMMDFESAYRLMEQGVIEVAPLAFMRGRTLNDAFVILDEAQNATSEQMKMFLTRLGFSSKAVITGDVTQTDLPNGKTSGLVEARGILEGIQGIRFVHFSRDDVIRHPLVQEIIDAYERLERSKARGLK